MANAPHDGNFIKARMGVLCTDGTTLVPIAINPDTGGVLVDTTSSISYTPTNIDPRDANFQGAWMGTSSVDGSAIPINVNAQGAILISN